MRFILIALFSMVTFQASAADQRDAIRCTHFGGFKEKVCPASMVGLTSDTQRFHGRTVAVSGYVKVIEGKPYLFTGKEFADNFSMADSILLTGQVALLKGKNSSWMTLIGILRPLSDLDYTDDIFRPIAKLDVQVIR